MPSAPPAPSDRLLAAGWVSAGADLMGGRVSVHLRPATGTGASSGASDLAAAQVLARIEAWASRLTRFEATSELSRLNAATADRVPVGPTLTALLDWGRAAETLTAGIVDIGLLDARVLAEADPAAPGRAVLPAYRRWSLTRRQRGAILERPAGLRFDLDGIAKGWLADRALDLLPGVSAVIDADGDLAVRVADDEGWEVGVADPRDPGTLVSTIHLSRGHAPVACYGLATSGTSVHRWSRAGRTGHHLIDPRTGRPARTDVVQATVIAHSARVAEAFAKTAVIVGSDAAATRLDRSDVLGQILLTESGDVLVTPATLEFLE